MKSGRPTSTRCSPIREVRAIFAVRGGWGSARILPHLDFDLIRANPKLLIGFSDITALHLALAARTDCPTIHGPNAASAWGRLSWDSFRRLAFDAETPTWRDSGRHGGSPGAAQRPDPHLPPGPRGGTADRRQPHRPLGPGRTPYLPSFDGAILFIEDIDEAQYRIDRMLTQLRSPAFSGAWRAWSSANAPIASPGTRHRSAASPCPKSSPSTSPRSACPPSRAPCSARRGPVQHPRRRARRDRRGGGDDPDAGAGGRLEAPYPGGPISRRIAPMEPRRVIMSCSAARNSTRRAYLEGCASAHAWTGCGKIEHASSCTA